MVESYEGAITGPSEGGTTSMLYIPGPIGRERVGIMSERGASQLVNTILTSAGVLVLVGGNITVCGTLGEIDLSHEALRQQTPVVRTVTPTGDMGTPITTVVAGLNATSTAEAELDVTRTAVASEQEPTPEVQAIERAEGLATREAATAITEAAMGIEDEAEDQIEKILYSGGFANAVYIVLADIIALTISEITKDIKYIGWIGKQWLGFHKFLLYLISYPLLKLLGKAK